MSGEANFYATVTTALLFNDFHDYSQVFITKYKFKEILYSYQIILFFLYFGKFFTVSMNLLFISSKRCMIRQKRKKTRVRILRMSFLVFTLG